jgi:hypothetical protein
MIWEDDILLIPGRSRYFAERFTAGFYRVPRLEGDLDEGGPYGLQEQYHVTFSESLGGAVVERLVVHRSLNSWERLIALQRARELTPKMAQEWRERMARRRRTLRPPVRRRRRTP